MAELFTTTGKFLKCPQPIFPSYRPNWSTIATIECKERPVDIGYSGNQNLPHEANEQPAIVIRNGYGQVRGIFILKKNVSKEEWIRVASEAIARPEVDGNVFRSYQVTELVFGIKMGHASEYPFPAYQPKIFKDEIYEAIKFICPGVADRPCQRTLKRMPGKEGSLCKKGDEISYSTCSAMPCNCHIAQEYHNVISKLEACLPTREQFMLAAEFAEEERASVDRIIANKRQLAARKGWETRRIKLAAVTATKE